MSPHALFGSISFLGHHQCGSNRTSRGYCSFPLIDDLSSVVCDFDVSFGSSSVSLFLLFLSAFGIRHAIFDAFDI